MKRFTVAIAGLGGRGYHTYAKFQHLRPEQMKIVAIADIDKEKIELAASEFNVPLEGCFASAEEMLSCERLADVVFITTQDRQHKEHIMMALEKGYDVLLEKPISVTPKDCIEIRDKVLELGRSVTVCHVLRYTKFFEVVKEAIDSGIIGKVQTVQAIENVGYWHQAHSFVRGNWRNSEIETPMILQKCCHDFDVFIWLLGLECRAVSSFGSLGYFKKENAPNGSAERCVDCTVENCPFNAEHIYLDERSIGLRNGNIGWPCDIVVENPTEEKLKVALKTSPYGRCVFHCDNNVVDHQVVNMLFDGGVTVQLTMTGFTEDNYRYVKVMGTKGQIEADQKKNIVTVTPFGCDPIVYDISVLAEDLSGHGGGDNKMLKEMFEMLENGGQPRSAISDSVGGHLIAFAAEESRLHDGELVKISEFEKKIHITE